MVPVGTSGLTLSTVAVVRGVYANVTFAAPVQLTKSTRRLCLPDGMVRLTVLETVSATFFHRSTLRTPSTYTRMPSREDAVKVKGPPEPKSRLMDQRTPKSLAGIPL